jgi:threonine dehydrogenase-like Zn-dependent dehydrogenase
MKAAIFYGPRDIRVEEVETPKPQSGEVLLHVKACGICGSDLHEYKTGRYHEMGVKTGIGKIIGHEYSGEVAELGKGVEGLKIGDRVVSIGGGANADYVKISAMARPLILPMPTSLSFEEAATTEPLATSIHGVNLAAPEDKQTIVVLGMGLIGLGVLQILKARSKAKVFAVDVSERRLDMAKKLGADVVINARQEDPYAYALKTTGSTKLVYLEFPCSGVDTVIDCAGFSQESQGEPPLWGALKMVKPNGKVVEIAVLEKSEKFDLNDLNIVMRKNIYLIGSWTWTPLEFFQAFEMLKSGVVQRKQLISHTFPLSKAKEAYETQLNTKEAIKVMIVS